MVDIENPQRKNNEIRNICLYVTGDCNGTCTFCYSPSFYFSSEDQRGNLSDFKKYIDILVGLGANSFVITGGEPLLYKNLFTVLQYIKEKNCKINLNTNAIGFTDSVIKQIFETVDVLGLPLDSLDITVNRTLGRGSSFEKVMEFLDIYKTSNGGSKLSKIKIATVATALNLHLIPAIYEVLPKENCFWKIYQFCSRGRGIENASQLNITDKEFVAMGDKIKEFGLTIDVVLAAANSIDRSNYLILPSGLVVMPEKETYVCLGNVADKNTQKMIVDFWETDSYGNNANLTYL